MITGIAIENFKGIGQRVEIPFKPITLLFGPNSSGKSSIIHALHYAREIFERGNLNPDFTISGGKFVDLGGFHGLVHQHVLSRPVKLAIDLDLKVGQLPVYDESPPSDSDDVDLTGDRSEPPNDFLETPSTARVEIEICQNHLHAPPQVLKYSVWIDGDLVGSIAVNETGNRYATIQFRNSALIHLGRCGDLYRLLGKIPEYLKIRTILTSVPETQAFEASRLAVGDLLGEHLDPDPNRAIDYTAYLI